MTLTEYRSAVKKAQRIMFFGKPFIDDNTSHGVHLTKAQALLLIKYVDRDSNVRAEWADHESRILFVG